MLIDYDPVDGFRFPGCPGIGLLRVIPLHPAEVRFVESYGDQTMAYLALVNRGLESVDPDRESVV